MIDVVVMVLPFASLACAMLAGKFTHEKKYGSAVTMGLGSIFNIVMFAAILVSA
jgi:hypothetical protein